MIRIATVLIAISCLTFARASFAQNSIEGIVVISDLHLYDKDFNFDSIKDPVRRQSEQNIAARNLQSFERTIDGLTGQTGMTTLVVNGDIMHGPSMSHLTPEEKIKRAIDVLLEIRRKIQGPIYFNIGNHDVLVEFREGLAYPVAGSGKMFEQAFNRALAHEKAKTGVRPDLRLIGAGDPRIGDFRAVYDISINGQAIKISHTPFVTSDAIKQQAEVFKTLNPRAYDKVTNLPSVTENTRRTLYIQSDSHTPSADPKLRIFNTGMLTLDPSVPFPQPTFLVVGPDGGKHIELDPSGKFTDYKFNPCPAGFAKLNRR